MNSFTEPATQIAPCEAEEAPADGLIGHNSSSSSGILLGTELFFDRVSHSLRHADRAKQYLAIFQIIPRRLDVIRDGLGRSTAAAITTDMAARIVLCMRDVDTVAKIGDDTFVIAAAMAAASDAQIIADKLLASLSAPYLIDGNPVAAGCSIGISVHPDDGVDASVLIDRANHALRHAAGIASDRYVFFAKDMNRRATARLHLETQMRRALENGDFNVHYQPKVSAGTGDIVGAEVLARWTTNDGDSISPAAFIPIAEETGLIEPLGDYIVDLVARQISTWIGSGISPGLMSINISPRQFRKHGFASTLIKTLLSIGAPPALVDLEITEGMVMHDVAAAERTMSQIREAGLSLSIDDFGTGYSSLSYLGHFPFTTLKIDKAFVGDVTTNPKTAAISRAIIALAQSLDLDIVAEGCETVEQVRFFQRHGCTTIQGFYFSPPVPAADYETMIRGGLLLPRSPPQR